MGDSLSSTTEAVTGVVLAGGRSTRFGTDKASAVVAGRPLLEWVARGITPACESLVLVRAKDQPLPDVSPGIPVLVVEDRYEAHGPLAGLVTGFEVVETPLAFAVSCDVPFVSAALVAALAAFANGHDIVVPHVDGFAQPLLAIYRPSVCLPAFRQAVERGQLKITTAYTGLRVRVVREPELVSSDPELASFENINRSEDLDRLAARLTART